jgi:MFS family permease
MVPRFKISRRIFYGWWVLVACAVIQFYLGGTFFQGFTALFNPIADEFSWSYATVSLAFTFRGFEAGVLAPIIGILVDRLGTRKLLLTGTIIMGVGFLLFSQIHALWSFYVICLVLALGLSLASGVVTMAAVAGWFRQRTSLAMGILTSGFGASGLMVPILVWVIDQWGWRWTVIIAGIGTWLLCVPLSLLVKPPPRDNGLIQPNIAAPSVGQTPKVGGAKEIMKRKEFWFLSLAVLFGGVAGSAVIVHQVPYLVSVGISRQTAGFMVVVLSLSNVAGRLVFGWLGEFLNKRYCFIIATLLKAAGVLAFAFSGTVWQFIPSLIALGLGFGGLIPLRPTLQIEFFGMTAFATVQGLLMAFITFGTIVAPPFAGWVYDVAGSYRLAFIVLAIATVLAVPMILSTFRRAPQRFV